MIRKILVIALVLGAFVLFLRTARADPSPYCKQLNVGALAYCSSHIWSGNHADADSLRKWFAERFSFCVQACDSDDVAEMYGYNPNIKIVRYAQFILDSDDTTDVKDWADSVGIDFDSLIIRADTGAGDSLRCRAWMYESEGFAWWRTTEPGAIMIHSGFTDAQTRFAWDYRNEHVGSYLAYYFRKYANEMGCDGVMMDEEGCVGHTGNAMAGLAVTKAPFKDTTSSYWTAGGPYDWQNPWDSSLSPYDIRDSLRTLRDGWMKALGDSMSAHDMLVIPNWASSGGPYNSMTNWNNEARHAHTLTKGVLMGEYCYYCPSADGQQAYCNNAASACSSLADSSVELWVWPIRNGQFDTSATDSFTVARGRMNCLGFMLDCLFPGSTTYRFALCPSIKVNFLLGRWLNGIQLDDTTTNWDYAFGKYFGEPTYARAETLTGTDGEGQSYTIHEVRLKNPNDTCQTLTLAVGRYTNGSNRRLGATGVQYDLPAGTWYELLSGGDWEVADDTAYIANAHWRFFSADTVLANDGPSEGETSVRKFKGWKR